MEKLKKAKLYFKLRGISEDLIDIFISILAVTNCNFDHKRKHKSEDYKSSLGGGYFLGKKSRICYECWLMNKKNG